MHPSSYNLMKRFRAYVPAGSSVLDVGGADVNGSYKDLFADCTYKTLDWEKADYIVKGYDWDVPQFDCVISGQTLEHDGRFWLTLENIKKIVRNTVIIIVPSGGKYHANPVDCYRFYPDSRFIFSEILGMKCLKYDWLKNYWGDLGMVFGTATS